MFCFFLTGVQLLTLFRINALLETGRLLKKIIKKRHLKEGGVYSKHYGIRKCKNFEWIPPWYRQPISNCTKISMREELLIFQKESATLCISTTLEFQTFPFSSLIKNIARDFSWNMSHCFPTDEVGMPFFYSTRVWVGWKWFGVRFQFHFDFVIQFCVWPWCFLINTISTWSNNSFKIKYLSFKSILKICNFLIDRNFKKFKSRLFVLHCPFHKAKNWHFECFNSNSNVNNSILCCKINVFDVFFLWVLKIFWVTSWLQKEICDLTLSKQITLIKKHHQVPKTSQVKRRSGMFNRKWRNKLLNPLNTVIIFHQK